MDPAYLKFVERWTHPEYRPHAVAKGDLDAVEAELSFCFPAAYREFLEAHGPIGTTSVLLTHLVEHEMDLSDISYFLPPAQIGSTAARWHDLGLPQELLPFATDCGGSFYCFHRNDGLETSPDAMVYAFDHDFAETECLEMGFRQWITTYAEL